jgi:hypothetical protein
MAQQIAANPAICVFLLACKNCGIHQKNCEKEPGLEGAPINFPTALHTNFAAEHEKNK